MHRKLLFRILITFIFISATLPVDIAYSQTLFLTPEYMGNIQQRMYSCLVYPQEAKDKGWEGIVKVRFALAQDGRVKSIDIAESSGYPLLDAAAMLAIKDASPYPFPKDYNYKKKGELEIIMPVNYVNPQAKPQEESPQGQHPITQTLQHVAQQMVKGKERADRLQQAGESNPPQEAFKFTMTPPDLTLPAGKTVEETRELAYYVELALKNNQPTKVAREEVEFAKIKVMEAQRNFFPAFKIQAYNTTGEVYKVDYEEQEAKLQVDQPLFYGGRLKYSLKQAQTNLEISQRNYDRLRVDVIHKTETSYYNLVATRMNLNQQEALLAEGQKLLSKMEKLASVDMIIPLELNSTRSWLEQMAFKIDGIKQDLFMAELTLKQVLNTKDTPKIEAELIQPKKLDLDLDACLSAAMQNRPEVYLSELLVKFNDYGQKVETIRNKALTLDFTSYYGKYQGHFKTEPWSSSTNWYLGVKASIPWGASTFNNSYAAEASQPRFGQTSPTSSRSITGEFNLFDNMKRLSDKKRADIDLYRSISDFDESFKTVAFEVQDAFLNYQKSVLQMNTAEAEMRFRRNEAQIAEVRAMVGEASLSAAMEALFSLSEAQTKYTQALANYQISLANLRKATGYGLKI